MDILGFRRINDSEESATVWQQEVKNAASRGMTLTALDVAGGRIDEETGDYVYDEVTVRDARTNERIRRFTPDEFRSINFDIEGWFDANGPYEPQG